MNSKKLDTRIMVKAALLTALSIVMTRFLYFFVPLAGMPTLRISFGEIPIMMSGLMFGPLVGGITGLVADLVGVLINPQGAFHPGFTLSSILWGAIPGLFLLIFKRSENYESTYSFKKIFISVLVSFVVISLTLNTIWLKHLYGTGFIALLPGRLLNAAVSVPLQSVIITTLFKYLKSIIRTT